MTPSDERPAKGPTRKRGGGPRALAEAAARVTRPLFGRRGLADGSIVRHWAAIVGPALATQTAPERIAYSGNQRTEGTLHLRVANGALAVELQHLEPQLLERINGHFGYRAVTRLQLHQGPLPVTPPAPAEPRLLSDDESQALATRLEGIDDPDLRAALESLGRSMLARRKPPS